MQPSDHTPALSRRTVLRGTALAALTVLAGTRLPRPAQAAEADITEEPTSHPSYEAITGLL